MDDWALQREFESPQGRIRWDAFGDGSPVVLLHGTPNWSFLWRRVAPRLAESHRVYVFDWPGFGTSDRYAGQNISWEEQPRRLVELFAHWGLQRPSVVAFDFAPIFALRAHLFHGLDYAALVLADAAVIPPYVTDFSRHVRDHIGVFRALPRYVSEAMIEAHVRSATYHTLSEEVVAGYMRPWRGEEGVAAYWRAVGCYDEDLSRPVADRLEALRVPTLVLWGEHDAWLPSSMGHALTEAIPNARFQTLPAAGHFSPEDNPASFADAVRAFLAAS